MDYEDEDEWLPSFARTYEHVVGWVNKMFVRPDLMPHQIKIKGIKIERLQDISDEDCIKEGIYMLSEKHICHHYPTRYKDVYSHGVALEYFDTQKEAYASLINAISGKGTWECNPWVICYSFELIK